jgi:hypothetical protein
MGLQVAAGVFAQHCRIAKKMNSSRVEVVGIRWAKWLVGKT